MRKFMKHAVSGFYEIYEFSKFIKIDETGLLEVPFRKLSQLEMGWWKRGTLPPGASLTHQTRGAHTPDPPNPLS